MEKKMLARYPIGNPRRLWQQDRFMLSTFSPGDVFFKRDDPDAAEKMRRAVKTCADAGFNLLELGWATPDQSRAALPMCEQLGMPVIYQNLCRYGGMGKSNVFCETSDLPGVMDENRKWNCVAGYYIWDEPWTIPQMQESRRLMDLCQRKMPHGLPFIVALPSYNTDHTWENGLYADYLENYAAIIDPPVMSFDYYPVGMREHDLTRQLDESKMWCDLAQVKKTADKHHMPFWFYYQGQNLHHVDFFIFPMVRLMMNAGVLYGAKGLQHYTACEAVVDPDGSRGEFFQPQKEIHAHFRELGNTLMALDLQRVIHDRTLRPAGRDWDGLWSEMRDSELLDGELPRRISVSEHKDAYGNDYLMVLNRDYMEEKDISLPLRKESHIYEVSGQDGMQHHLSTGSELSLSLLPGEMKLFRLQCAREIPYTIEYQLTK